MYFIKEFADSISYMIFIGNDMDDKISSSGIKLNLKFIYTAVETNKYSKAKAIIPLSNLIIIYIWSKFNWNELPNDSRMKLG